MADDDVRVVLHQGEIDKLSTDPALRAELLQRADPIVRESQFLAPKRTGLGAASIHVEAVLDGAEWTARIGWTRDRFYMWFQHAGTQTLPARPFLVQAAKEFE
jgi:hypothetical protein